MKIQKKSNRYFDFPKYFDDDITRTAFDLTLFNRAAQGTAIPLLNVFEKEDEYLIELIAPGIRKEDLFIELNNDILTISRGDLPLKSPELGKSLRREFNFGKFIRTIRLSPSVINDLEADATLDNGILTLRIPKAKNIGTNMTRKIAVN